MRLPEPRGRLLQEVSLGSIIASYVAPSLHCVQNNATRGVEPLPERPDVPDLRTLILRLESVEQAPAVLLHVSIYPHHQSGLSPLA
jgi:hypothetical protein